MKKNKVIQIKTKEELKLLEEIMVATIVSMSNQGTLTQFLQNFIQKQNDARKKPNPFKVRYHKIQFPDTMVLIQGLQDSKPIYYIQGLTKFTLHASDVGEFVNSMIADGHHISIRPNGIC